MANHKSAKKRMRQSLKRNARNKSLISSYKTEEKKLRKALESKKTDKIKELLNSFFSKADNCRLKGLMHKNVASRKKSQLAKLANSSYKTSQ